MCPHTHTPYRWLPDSTQNYSSFNCSFAICDPQSRFIWTSEFHFNDERRYTSVKGNEIFPCNNCALSWIYFRITYLKATKNTWTTAVCNIYPSCLWPVDNHNHKNRIENFFACVQFQFLSRPISTISWKYSFHTEMMNDIWLIFCTKTGWYHDSYHEENQFVWKILCVVQATRRSIQHSIDEYFSLSAVSESIHRTLTSQYRNAVRHAFFPLSFQDLEACTHSHSPIPILENIYVFNV